MSENRKGFSLVEMSIVLIIFGLVLASASSILTLFVNKGGAERTRKMIEANKNVLYSIAAARGKYDSHTLESLTYPKDAYGREFAVFLDATLFKYVKMPFSNKSFLDYSPICGTDSTTYSVNVCSNANCSDFSLVDNIAAVLVSGSANKNIQTAPTKSEFNVYLQGTSIDDYTGDMNRNESYDDIVDWITLPELRTKAGCEPQRLDFLSTEMPEIKEGDSYYFTIYPKGGIPFENQLGGYIPKYNFRLEDPDGLTDGANNTGVGVYVRNENPSGDVALVAGAVTPVKGINLIFRGNTATNLDSSYRVRIIMSDDSKTVSGKSNNEIMRTLYIIKK